MTNNEVFYSKSTEILNIKDQKWIIGPNLPCGIGRTECVSLPPSTNFACIIVGGATIEENLSSNVYGLNKNLSEWTPLGKIRKGRQGNIALPLS